MNKTISLLLVSLFASSCNSGNQTTKNDGTSDTIKTAPVKVVEELLPDTSCESLVKSITDKFTKEKVVLTRHLYSNQGDTCLEIYAGLQDDFNYKGKDIWLYFKVKGQPVCVDEKFSVYFLFENDLSIRTVGLSSINCEGNTAIPLNGTYDGSKQILKQLLTSKVKSIRIEGDHVVDFNFETTPSIEFYHSIKCLNDMIK